MTNSNNKSSHKPKMTRPLVMPVQIINEPDIAYKTTMQNLLWFTVESLGELTTTTGETGSDCTIVSKCITHLDELTTQARVHLNEQAQNKLFQFVDEAKKADSLLRQCVNQAHPNNTVIPESVATVITAKTTYLNWLAVCICEECRLSK